MLYHSTNCSTNRGSEKKKITGKVIFSICADIYNHNITQNIIVKYYTHYVFQ